MGLINWQQINLEVDIESLKIDAMKRKAEETERKGYGGKVAGGGEGGSK